ncbi:MAG: DUF63 family protein [archaeon]
MSIIQFFTTYFAEPLCSPIGGYNIYNTLAYGLLTALVAFGLFRLLKFFKVKIDYSFFWGAAPFVILGSFWHVYEDSVVQCIPWFEAPIIYLLFAAVGIAAMLLGIIVERKSKIKLQYWQVMLLVAAVGSAVSALSFYKIAEPGALFYILGITGAFAFAFSLLGKKWDKVFTPINKCVLTTAMFDAASTAVGMSMYGYGEKHILPTFFINLFGSAWIMLPLKFIVVFSALLLIDKLEEDTQFKNIIKFAVLVVTLGPGSRNLLRIVMGV